MLKRIIKEANSIEIIKIDLKNKIWEQLESNKDQKEDPKTGSQVREKQHEGEDRLEHNLVPPKLDSGQPTLNKGLAQGLKTSQEGLSLNGGFQESTKKDALLGKNLKDDKKGLKCSIPRCDFKTAATKKAKRQIRKHEEKHREEKTRISADNKTTIHGNDNNQTSNSQANQTSDGSLLEDTGNTYQQTSDLLDYNGEREHVLTGVHYTECALCETPFIEYGDIYCKDGCPNEALERLDDNLQPVKANNAEKISHARIQHSRSR